MLKFRPAYLIFSVILFTVEVLIAIYINDNFIRPYFGDFLVVILLYCMIRSVININVFNTSVFVLLFAYLVEFLQYMQIIRILGLEKYGLARVIIGTSFSWTDILSYTLGILMVLLLEKRDVVLRLKPADKIVKNQL